MALPGAEIIERASLAAWPGLEIDWDGAWVRRAAGGYTKRANSVQSLDVADDDNAAARLADAVDWFRARGLPPVFRQTPLAGPGIRAVFDTDGWRTIDASYLFAMELGPIEPDPRAVLYHPLDPAFLAAQQQLQRYDDARLGRLRAVLGAVAVPARGLVLYDTDGAAVASSFMDIADGIVITGNVITHPDRRRRGFGRAMMLSGLAWAYAEGARVAALNVAADNPVGQALYRGLGYAHQYDYAYRIPPAHEHD